MHDWKQMVRTSLRNLHIDPTQEKDIVSELASHLEDKYDVARSSGLSDGEACELCRMELADGQSTARKIQLAKIKEGAVNYRTKTLWIPGLVTLTVASVVLMVVERIVLSQPKVSSAISAALSYYVPWLISLPFCGALGAYLSRRAGGNSLSRSASAAFPAVVMLGVFFLILPVALFIERNRFIIHHLQYFAGAVFIWIVAPGAALLLGAVLVRGESAPSQTRLSA